MLYTVKSKSLLPELKEVLNSRQFKPIMKDTYLEVEVSEEEKDEFALILAFAISYNAFKKILWDEMKRLKVEQGLAERFFYEATHYYQNSKYWTGLTKVWMNDFLDTHTTVNADTFATFNLKGFKLEIKHYIENLLVNEEAYQDSKSINSHPFEPVSMENMFEVMKERVAESGLNPDEFREFHVREKGEGFIIENQNGSVLDEKFFLLHVGIMIHVGMIGEDLPPSVEDSMSLIALCHIFEPNKVIIHQGLSESAEKSIEENKVLMTQFTSKEIAFVSCEGCEKCDKEE